MGKLAFKGLLILGICLTVISCGYLEGGKSNVQKDGFIYIASNGNYSEVLDSLQPFLIDMESFKSYAEVKEYPNLIKAGKYKIEKGESNESLLNKLRAGLQVEVPIRIKNEPTIFHLAQSVSKSIEADSAQIVDAMLNWQKVADENLDAETVKQFFIPNTYNFYWASSGEDFVNRMHKEYNKIWTDKRIEKAKELDMSPLEVVILASIVQSEAPKADEQAKVARAYLNRLDKGMKLEADPTAIYAYKLQNGFNNTIQRVYNKHLQTSSSYNTYKTKGIPPAPICLPNLSAVEAVLNPAEHNFIYFCANPDKPGYHSFTSSYAEHERNAAKYRKWLRKNNIR